MVSVDQHRELSVGPGDTVVLSSRTIPGNERTVSRLIGNLYRRGCDVVHSGTAKVHVSGHASREDLVELLRLVRPRYVVPIHGEYRMLVQHAQLATQAGLPAESVYLLENGNVLSLDGQGARLAERVPAGRVLLDRSGGNGLEDVVIRDRRHLSSDGVVVPIIVVDKRTGRVETAPEIVTRGFVDSGERAPLLERAGRLVVEAVESRSGEELQDPGLTRERVRVELRRFFKKQTQRRPMVIPVVMEL
jgi:ribonuclease J